MVREFFIKEGSELPLLVMKIIKNVYNDEYIDNVINKVGTLTFSMKSDEDCNYKILNKTAHLMTKEKDCVDCVEKENEYFIYYKFSKRDTNVKGRYIGEFTLNLDGDEAQDKGIYKLPVRDELIINII